MTLRSMTAYGRATLELQGIRLSVELQSLNRKHLEFNIQLPPELTCFDSDLRHWLTAAITRGQICVKVQAIFDDEAPVRARPNLALAVQLRDAWKKVASSLGLTLDDAVIMQLLSQQEGLITYENSAHENEALHEVLKQTLAMATDKLLSMKIAEGMVLQADITMRLAHLETWLKRVEELAPLTVGRYCQKLRERLAELLPHGLENDERILREVGIYADRVDINEETLRFKSHLQQFYSLINSAECDIGKTLDFLVQEMKREVNTIGSKAAELEIAQIVIDMKSEIERIREQIQNVE